MERQRNHATKNLERLRSFFRFCQQGDWITKNSARAVKAPKVKDKSTLPHSKSEMERILTFYVGQLADFPSRLAASA